MATPTRRILTTAALLLGLGAVTALAPAASTTTLVFDFSGITLTMDPAYDANNQPISFNADYTGWLHFASNTQSSFNIYIDNAWRETFLGTYYPPSANSTMLNLSGSVYLQQGIVQESHDGIDSALTLTGQGRGQSQADSYSVLLRSVGAGQDIIGGLGAQRTYVYTLDALTYAGTLLDGNSDGCFGNTNVAPWLAVSPNLQGSLVEFNIAMLPGGQSRSTNGDMYTTVAVVPLPAAAGAGGAILALLAAGRWLRRPRAV